MLCTEFSKVSVSLISDIFLRSGQFWEKQEMCSFKLNCPYHTWKNSLEHSVSPACTSCSQTALRIVFPLKLLFRYQNREEETKSWFSVSAWFCKITGMQASPQESMATCCTSPTTLAVARVCSVLHVYVRLAKSVSYDHMIAVETGFGKPSNI